MSRSSESISQDKGHPPIPSLTEGPSCTFGPAQARWDRRPRSDRHWWRGEGKTIPFVKATIPVTSVLWEKDWLWRPREEGRKKGLQGQDRPWVAVTETGSGQGLQQAPRRERHRSSTAGPTIAFQPLWAYVASCCDGQLLKNPSPRWLWWRHFGSFISKTLNERLKIQLGSQSSLRELLHPSAKQLQSIIKKVVVGTCLHL